MVEDTVRYLPREVFAALKTASRARQVTLNGPLALLFARAFWDAASVSGGTDAKPPGDAVLASCAVDIRRRLDPPLPHNYISSAAGTANVAIHIPPTAGMSSSTAAEQDWKAAALFSDQLAAAIDANEPFRMKQILATHKYAQIATLFDVSFIWSNVGHLESSKVKAMELHMMGPGTNSLVAAHTVEVNGNLAITLTYSPKLYCRQQMDALLDGFCAHAARLVQLE
jgi:hypothetical protein